MTGGESQGLATETSGCPGRHLEAEEGLYLPEVDRASLHDSEGLLSISSTKRLTVQGVDRRLSNQIFIATVFVHR